MPTAVDAGLPGPGAAAAAAADAERPGDGASGPAGAILMTLGGMLLAGGATTSLRRRGRHTA